MGILIFSIPTVAVAIANPIIMKRAHKMQLPSNKYQFCRGFPKLERIYYSISGSGSHGDEEQQLDSPQELRVPSHWLEPSRAAQESTWLRNTLHKWLDDEYCPEATNVEISKIAADSYYTSLLEKRDDLGDILLKMALDLESISYQDSFHGAFSSANAAVNLLVQRILHDSSSLPS